MIFSRRCALSSCTLALELATLLIIVVPGSQSVFNGITSSAYVEKDPTFMRMRPRLGYFPEVSGYLKIYEEYVENVLKPNDMKFEYLNINDWRNVRPEGELCIDFLQGFQVNGHKLNKAYEIVLLDACIFWLYESSEEKDFDVSRFNSATKKELKAIKKDAKFKEISESTMFKGDKLPQKLKNNIHEYLLRLMKIYNENPRNGCHSLWMEAYNDFIEDIYLADCEDEDNCLFFELEGADKDSYLSLIVESTKDASKDCFNVMQTQMNGLMHKAYDDETMTGLYTKLKAATSKVARQSKSHGWSREMIRILQLITQTDVETPIDLTKVVEVLHNLKNNDDEEVKRFTKSIADFAMSKVNLKDTVNDPQGRIRFGKALTKLCRPYIDPKEFLSRTGGSTLWEDEPGMKKPFEFYHLIYSLIRITNHEAIFMVTKQKFEEDVLKNDWVALYLATFACQMISTTWGRLNYDTNEGKYTVSLRPNARVLIEDWPIDLIETELTQQTESSEPDNDDDSVDDEPEPEPAPSVVVQHKAPVAYVPPRQVAVPPPAAPEPKLETQAPVKQVQKQPSNVQSESSGRYRFKNPLRAHKNVEPVKSSAQYETAEMAPPVVQPPPSVTQPLVNLDRFHPIDDGEVMPNNNLSSSTNELFKALHGKYPKKDKLSSDTFLAPKKEKPAPQVPLAFNFDASYTAGADEVKKEPAPVDKWAGINAMSF